MTPNSFGKLSDSSNHQSLQPLNSKCCQGLHFFRRGDGEQIKAVGQDLAHRASKRHAVAGVWLNTHDLIAGIVSVEGAGELGEVSGDEVRRQMLAGSGHHFRIAIK